MTKNQMVLNEQPISKPVRDKTTPLLVHSIFDTIQGEGPFCGHRAIFVRLAGCNLQCPMCDTEYTKGTAEMSVPRIVDKIKEFRFKEGTRNGLVVITGGEPFRQQIGILCNVLARLKYFVQIETNGTLPPVTGVGQFTQDIGKRSGVYVVCSPKAGKVHSSLADVACCYKYVANADSIMPADGLPSHALGHTAHPYLARPPEGFKGPIYLQPEDSKDSLQNQRNMEAVVAACREHGHILQLQIHKYLGLE